MTVATSSITSGPYSGNDVADTFAYGFKANTISQISVFEIDSLGTVTQLTATTDFTATGLGSASGGSVVRVAGALPTGSTWYVRANYAETQDTAFASQGGFFPTVHEDAFDKLTFLIQQQADRDDRSLRVADTDFTVDSSLQIIPAVADRLSSALAFDATGLPYAAPLTASDGATKAYVDAADALKQDRAAKTKALTGTSTTLTDAEVACGLLKLTGALATSDHTLNLPAGFVGSLHILNNTTNDFAVNLVQTATVELPRGIAWPVVSDGTTVAAGNAAQRIDGNTTSSTGTASTSSTTYINTGLSVTYTPKTKTGKLTVEVSSSGETSAANVIAIYTIFRDGVDTSGATNGFTLVGDGSTSAAYGSASMRTEASSTSLASTTFDVRMKATTANLIYLNGSTGEMSISVTEEAP